MAGGNRKKLPETKKEKESSSKVKRMRDKNAPKVPANVYSRFLMANLKNFRKENEKSNDTNIRLAAEWAKMSEQEKKPYRDDYIKARDVYYEQKAEYKKTAQYKDYIEVKNKRRKRSQKDAEEGKYESEDESKKAGTSKVKSPGGIRIFSNEFLDHNKEQERKLKAIRKQKNDAEEECERIHEHVEQMNAEIRQMRENIVKNEGRRNEIEMTMSNWKNAILEALCKARLLDSLKLDQHKCTTEELILKLEEIGHPGKNAENTRLQLSVKQALTNLRIESG